MTSLALLLCLAAPPARAAAPPRTPAAWVLGASPTAGAWATYETHADLVTYVGGAEGMREGKITQRTRVTFLYLGPATVAGARGEWLELQEELLELKGDGVPEGMAAPGGVLVTRVFLAKDGKVLRTVVQARGRPAEERPVVEGMSVAIGALAPFDLLGGKTKAGKDTIEVPSLGNVAALTHEAAGAQPRRSVKIWRRATDGLCLRIVDATEGAGTTRYGLAASGRGGATKIEGPIQTVDGEPGR